MLPLLISLTAVCFDGAPVWRGLCVRPEPAQRVGYVRADTADAEAELIRRLPPGMVRDHAGGVVSVVTPFSCMSFLVDPETGKAATDVDHVVALAEAHDSGLAPSLRHAFANDLRNQTVAVPAVNRYQKGDRDAAEWEPLRNAGWFAARTVEVKRAYGLSVDPAERDALEALLTGNPALDCP